MATLTETLSNGLKSLFSGLGAKTTNTTNGGVPLLNTSTGEPNGMMAMENLAAVLGAANTMASVLDCRVAEATSGDLNNLKKGMVYIADKGILSNEPPTMDQGPCAYFFFGKTGMDRGIQVCFHVSNTNGVANIFMRGQLYSGWSAWKSITLT